MKVQRRTNPMWGVVLLALAAVFAARALGYIPAGVFDLILRAWPALLVLAGLSFLLRRLAVGGLIALVLTVVIVAGVAAAAYSGRASQQRSDYQQPIEQPLNGDITLLRLRVETLATGLELITSATSDPVVSGEFTGSAESRLDMNYEPDAADNSATLTLREVQPGGFPSLESVGRGTLRLEIPPGTPVDLDFTGGDGSVVLNMDGLDLERLNVFVTRGDLVVTLPGYQPVLSGDEGTQGTLTTRDGDLAIFIPLEVAARLELNREGSGIEPQYDANIYNYLVGDVLEARAIETANVVVRYTLTVPRGLIRIEVPPS